MGNTKERAIGPKQESAMLIDESRAAQIALIVLKCLAEHGSEVERLVNQVNEATRGAGLPPDEIRAFLRYLFQGR
jgi:uncharacterized membrane protein YjjP (DUF1212 family)